MNTFLHLSQEQKEKEKTRKHCKLEGNEVQTQGQSRAVEQKLQTLVMSLTQGRMKERNGFHGPLSLMPLVTATCSRGERLFHCNCCYYSWEDSKYTVPYASIPSDLGMPQPQQVETAYLLPPRTIYFLRAIKVTASFELLCSQQ